MQSEEFYNLVSNASCLNAPDAFASVTQSVHDYTFNKCFYPKSLDVNISDIGEKRLISVRCGSCDNCRDLYRSEWCTRMYLETLSHPFVYMVTLHYRPYKSFDKIPPELLDAYWHYDNFNFNKHLSWNPCLCRIEHIQMFFRHLRYIKKNTNANIKYFFCMEYGHDYGRPHCHCIIWSDSPISRLDIRRSWSIIKGRKNPIYQSIGTFDFQDLKSNGTLVGSCLIDGQKRNAKYAFNYLCKYVCKDNNVNYSRVDLLRNDILNIESPNYEFIRLNYNYVFSNLSKWYKKLFNLKILKNYAKDELLSSYVYSDLMENIFNLAKSDKCSFYLLFKCFTSCSRAEGIGSAYANANIERFCKGNVAIEKAPFGELIFPRYFMRKIKEYLCPLQCRSVTSFSNSFSGQNRPLLFSHLSSIFEEDPFVSNNYVVREDVELYFNYSEKYSERINNLLRSPFAFKDPTCGYRLLIAKSYEKYYVYQFQYDRKLNYYVPISKQLFSDWFPMILNKYHESLNRTLNIMSNIEKQNSYLNSAIKLCDDICYPFNYNYIKLRTLNIEKFREERSQYILNKHVKYSPKVF